MQNLNQKKIEYHLEFLNGTHYDRRYLINKIGFHLNKIIALIKIESKIPSGLEELISHVNELPFTNVFDKSNSNYHNEEIAILYCSEALEIIYTIIHKYK